MVMMPEGAAASRAAQKSVMAGIMYDKQTDPELGQLLDGLLAANGSANFDLFQQAVIREAHRQASVPSSLPKLCAQSILYGTSACMQVFFASQQ